MKLPFRRSSPRTLLASDFAPLALIGTLLILLLALAAVLAWQAHQDATDATSRRAEAAAQVVAAHFKWLGEASYQALRRVDELMQADPGIVVPGSVGNLDRAVAALPDNVTIWVFDEAGNTVLSNIPDSANPHVAGRDYFEALADGTGWYISPLGRDGTSDRPVFIIAKRIERAGRFSGGAAIAIPAALLAEIWQRLDLGSGSTVGLIRSDGWLIARDPLPEQSVFLAGGALFDHVRQEPLGSYRSPRSPADGISRIVGYQVLEDFPVIAVAGISHDAALSPYWRKVGVAALVSVPIAAALLVVATWYSLLLRRYRKQQKELTLAAEKYDMLLKETHHRVKNNLQTASALIHMHRIPDAAKRDLASRIEAMIALHEQLYGSDQVEEVDLAAYIERLIASLRHSSTNGVVVSTDLQRVLVPSSEAMPIGLVISEVAINALKHAFPEGRAGSLHIELKADEAQHGTIVISDNGVGFDKASIKPGMGTRLIQGLARQAKASFNYSSSGTGTTFVLAFRTDGSSGAA